MVAALIAVPLPWSMPLAVVERVIAGVVVGVAALSILALFFYGSYVGLGSSV